MKRDFEGKMCRLNFRVKLDLCKFYSDVRRFCWIFIDGVKMSQIIHVKEHIIKIFNIKEPFHLLLNENEYLPPIEDIRILKENETILVCPGSGLENELEISASTIMFPESQDTITKPETTNNLVQRKELQTNFSSEPANPSPIPELIENESNLLDLMDESLNKSQSTLDSSTLCTKTEDEEDIVIRPAPIDSVTVNENVMESTAQRSKRKRVRRKKNKKQVEQPVTREENVVKKPTIVNSFVIPAGKHIHFDNIDTESIMKLQKQTIHGICKNKVSPTHELAHLLSLGQNSKPVTFANTLVKDEIKVEHTCAEDVEVNNLLENMNGNAIVNKKFQEGNILTAMELEACPVMIMKPQLKDVIAFKMLKIGSDYTPQVSEFIVGEVISCYPKGLMYTFKVLQGISEVQVPIGKFTLIQDEEEQVLNDTITLSYSQVIEPRLVIKSDPDKVPTPIHFNN